MCIESQLILFVASALQNADAAFVKDFVESGSIPGGVDGAYRYLLAVAMRNVSADEFAESTGVSEAVAQSLLEWLSAGTKAA